MWESRAGAGTLVIRDGRVLMVLRERSGKVRWELPSGLLEGGETLEEAAARETLEETSLKVEIGQLLCTAVMDVPEEHYRGINAYFCATAKGKGSLALVHLTSRSSGQSSSIRPTAIARHPSG